MKRKSACHGSTTVPRMREDTETGTVSLYFINLSHILIQTELSPAVDCFLQSMLICVASNLCGSLALLL